MKNWPFVLGGIVVLLLIVVSFFLFFRGGQEQNVAEQATAEKQVEPPEIQARPFFTFSPRGDGRAIQISISGISSEQEIDYEITYTTAAGLTQGIGGPVAQELGQTFYTREHIFGTCSKNVCTYDKGIGNGKWRATIAKGLETYELAGVWKLQSLGTQSLKLGLDGKFELQVEPATFSKSVFVIIAENSSLPKNLPSGVRLVSGSFTITPAETVSFKKPAKVSFVGGSAANFEILQISSQSPDWTTLQTSESSAATSTLGTFVLVEKI